MGRGTKTTEFLKECMADSLLKLMRENEPDKITIKEITDTAGVGRSTWFRNFSSKNEALTFKLVSLWNRYADEHNLEERCRYNAGNAKDFFEFTYGIRNILSEIYDADIQSAIYDAFYEIMTPRNKASAEECYESRFFSYGLFGLLDEWIKREFFETPEDMTKLFLKMMGI